MRAWLLGVVLLVAGAAAPAQAQRIEEGSAADRAAVVAVIENQIAAFKRDDGNAAFAHASPGIQLMFRTPEAFMRMVEQSYSAIYRPRSVEFRRLLIVRGEPVQEVFFVGRDLATMLALYRMEKQPDGTWRIDGVMIAETGEQAT